LSARKEPIPFFTDNDVPDAVGDFLKESGHTVIRLRDVMLDNSPDPVVAAACREQGMVLVTHNVKHFKKIVKDYEVTAAQADRLCRIELECEQLESVDRIRDALSTIETEWNRLGKNKCGLRISVGRTVIRIHR
jgi:predicted nuclease of predicted toxin-antitoxin system